MVFFAQATQIFALLAFLIGVKTRLLKLVVGDRVFHAMDDELHALLGLGNLLGKRGLAQLYAGPSFVDKIDGLVGQETVRNVTVGMRHGEPNSIVGIGDGV